MHSSPELTITNAILTGDNLIVFLSDGRIIIYPLVGMNWIISAPPEEQQDFTVTEWEIFWQQIDDGITLEHILSPKPRIDFTIEKSPNWEKFQRVLENKDESISQGVEEYQSVRT